MAYKVDKFNGTFLVNVADGSIDTTTDLRFIGKNYAGYGEVQNENFLHLMENFANASPPPKAQIGQIWYDSTATVKKIKFWDGTQWKVASGAVPLSTPPAGLTAGELWFDSSTNQISVWTGSAFVLVGPENLPELDSTNTVSDIVEDINKITHTILRVVVQDTTIMVFSSTEFDLAPDRYSWTRFGRFSRIKKGATLAFTDIDGVTQSDFYFWGTASTAEKLLDDNGVPLSINEFVLQSQKNRFGSDGIFIGVGNLDNPNDLGRLRVWVDPAQTTIIENQNYTDPNNALVFRLKTGFQSGEFRNPLVVSRTAVYPGQSPEPIDLGRIQDRWQNVYANQYFGDLTGNVTGNITGVHKGNLVDDSNAIKFDSSTGEFFGIFSGSFTGNFIGDVQGTSLNATNLAGFNASEAAVPSTIPVRTVNADIIANRFIGTASRADQLLVGAEYRSASTGQVADTVVARDDNASITAKFFNGTATAAQYADLAEKYLPDTEYETGTVMTVGGDQEVTACSTGDRAVGVISASPAYMMNSELVGGVYVALKGRVPVKVVGSVVKGQHLVASNNGCATATADSSSNVFAVALESNTEPGVKIIESLVL